MNRNMSAHTSYPNTPETDSLPEVLHDVNLTIDNRKIVVQIMASDPIVAMDKIAAMKDEEVLFIEKKARADELDKKLSDARNSNDKKIKL